MCIGAVAFRRLMVHWPIVAENRKKTTPPKSGVVLPRQIYFLFFVVFFAAVFFLAVFFTIFLAPFFAGFFAAVFFVAFFFAGIMD